MSKKQLAGLAKATKKKQQEALEKTEQAIAKLTETKQKITIASVARAAGVSKSYIYKYPELAYKIQRLREQQKYALVKADNTPQNTKKQIKILTQENEKLRQENLDLKKLLQNSAATDQNLPEILSHNTELQTENHQLKQNIQHLQQQLQESREFILNQMNNFS